MDLKFSPCSESPSSLFRRVRTETCLSLPRSRPLEFRMQRAGCALLHANSTSSSPTIISLPLLFLSCSNVNKWPLLSHSSRSRAHCQFALIQLISSLHDSGRWHLNSFYSISSSHFPFCLFVHHIHIFVSPTRHHIINWSLFARWLMFAWILRRPNNQPFVRVGSAWMWPNRLPLPASYSK